MLNGSFWIGDAKVHPVSFSVFLCKLEQAVLIFCICVLYKHWGMNIKNSDKMGQLGHRPEKMMTLG